MKISPVAGVRRLAAALAAISFSSSPVSPAATVYDSEGFETARFTEGDLDGQDAAPLIGAGPWNKDGGASHAAIVTTNPVEGLRSVRVSRDAAAAGGSRWGVVDPVDPDASNNRVDVHFDMRVVQEALDFGPMFGVEAYDNSLGSPRLIGSLLLDASTGELLYQEPVTAACRGTGVYLLRNVHHHFVLQLDFVARTCTIVANGRPIHTSGFVDPAVAAFTDAPIASLAAGSGAEEGIAYFDNYRIEHTTSALSHLLWAGDGTSNVWDRGVTRNWSNGVGTVAFADGADVVIDDRGSNFPAIELRGTLVPASVKVSGGKDHEFAGAGILAGDCGLRKEGGGRLILTGAHDYAGGTTVAGGELQVSNAAGSATGTGRVTVGTAGTLSGGGRVGGDVAVAPGGGIAPGTGTLVVGGHLTLDGALLKYELGSTSGLLEVAGDLVLDGGLEIADAGGFGPGMYRLIGYGGSLLQESLQIASAPPGYHYAVRTSTPGLVELVVQLPPAPPAAPEGLAAAAADSSAIELSWTDRSDNEDGFAIERSINNASFAEIAVTEAGATSFADGGLSSGTAYYYRVRAVNAGGSSAYSNVAGARTAIAPAAARYEFELTTLDSSGNLHHGAPAGTVLYGEGRVGEHAAAFDGSGFVSITRVVEDSFSVSMWIKTTGSGSGADWYNGMGLVDGEMVGGTADWGCSVLNSKFAFGVGAPDTTILSKRSVSDGLWHHVAATRDSASGVVRIYIDGALDTTGSAPLGPRTAPVELRIGATRTAVPVFFVGSMDELQFHRGVLNQAEIAELSGYPAPPPPPPAGEVVKVHPLGDSITWGYTTGSLADSPGGYREPLYRSLIANGGPAIGFLGANSSNPGPLLSRDDQTRHDGYPQYTINEISGNLDANAPTGKTRGNNGGFWLTGGGIRTAIEPDIILLLAGTNDIESGAEAAVIESRMDAMVGKIFALRPQTKVFLAGIPPYPADAAKTATAAAYNRLMVLRTVPKYLSQGRDIRFVDQYRNFIVGSGPAGDVVNAALYGDTIHPNEAGYQLMGDTWAAAILADPQPLPADPSNLVVAGASEDGISLEWTDASDNEGAFVIQRSLDGLSFEAIAYVGADVTHFTDTSIQPGVFYHYRVVARNSSGDSGASNGVTAMSPPDADYGGRAVVAGLGVLGTAYSWSDTGELPVEGGTREASVLKVDEPGVITAEIGHAFAVGQADRTRSEASAGDVSINAGGVPVNAGFAMARALAVWQSGGSMFVAGASEVGSLTVSGFPVAVTGEANQSLSLPGGKLVVNEQIATATGITVNALHLTLLDGTDLVVASARAEYESVLPPPPLGNDQFSGGGWIAASTGAKKGTFGVGGGREDGVLFGHLTYRDHQTGMRVKGTGVTAYGPGPSPESRRLEGTAAIDGAAGYTFAVVVEDIGEPGDDDTFHIELSNGYQAQGRLGGGNIQLHRPGE